MATIALSWFYKTLQSPVRLMLFLKWYRGQVRTALRYRLYYRTVTAQLRAQYRGLKRK